VGVIKEERFVIPFDVGAVYALNGKVEFGQTPGGLVGFPARRWKSGRQDSD